MAALGLRLLIHGEATENTIDEFDRERVFINTHLQQIISDVPDLRIVLEHISTAYAVEFVSNCSLNVRATITAHHLLCSNSDLFSAQGFRPHLFCKPILKKESDRAALLRAATSGDTHFFLGSDSAPHSITAKESSCCTAGVFSGHAVMELVTQAFASVNALDRLAGFTSIFGSEFYGISIRGFCKVYRAPWTVPLTVRLGDFMVVPFWAGKVLDWKCERMDDTVNDTV